PSSALSRARASRGRTRPTELPTFRSFNSRTMHLNVYTNVITSTALRRLGITVVQTQKCDVVRKPGFAPGPSASQAEMLLLHHNPDGLPAEADKRRLEPLVGLAPSVSTRPPYEFTKLVLWLLRHR